MVTFKPALIITAILRVSPQNFQVTHAVTILLLQYLFSYDQVLGIFMLLRFHSPDIGRTMEITLNIPTFSTNWAGSARFRFHTRINYEKFYHTILAI